MRYMGAQLGNKLALGHGYGRPPTYDAELEAKEIEIWSKKEDSYNLVDFCLERNFTSSVIYHLEERSAVFRDSLELAKMRLSKRRDARYREDEFPDKMWSRYAANFDPFLKKHEDDEKRFDSSLKQKEIASYTQADLDRQKQTVDQVLRAQEASSARKAADKISKSD